MLIGNFLGRRPSFIFVKEVTQKIWRLTGIVDTTMMESGLFVFRFNCDEDKQQILEGGIWKINHKPLILRQWRLNMELMKVDLSSLPLWVYLPNLLFNLWTKEALSIICNVPGNPLFSAKYTMRKERLSFDGFYV